MKLPKFNLFNKKKVDFQEDEEIKKVTRSKSLRLVRSHNPETMQHNPRVISDPFPNSGSLPNSPSTPTHSNLQPKRTKGNFVKAVHTVKNLTHKSSEEAFSTFFPENTCQKRAIYMLVHLKKQVFLPLLNKRYPAAITPLLSMIGDRLFSLFYVIKVIKAGPVRSAIMTEAQSLVKSSGLSAHICGTRETAYAIYYTLQTLSEQYLLGPELQALILENSSNCLKNCIERELKLSETEKESMYIFQQVMSNLSVPSPNLLVSKVSEIEV